MNDFTIVRPIHLEENRRCSRDVFALARKLVSINTPLFEGRITPRADHESSFPIAPAGFESDDEEASWIIDDIRRDVADRTTGLIAADLPPPEDRWSGSGLG